MIAEMARFGLALAVLIAFGALAPRPAAAEIYRYTDANGNSYYVEGLENVPQEHRARAVPMGLRNAPPAPPAPAAPAAPSGRPGAPGAPAAPGVPPAPTAPGSAPKIGGTSIRFTPGQRIMVDVTVNGTATANLLLDTGADRTMINPRVLVAAGASLARPVGSARVTGVAGSDEVSFVVVESLQIGEARVGRLPVASYDIGAGGDGLLGRDFLDRFNVTIDSTNGLVHLAPK
jgi:hypothetical protein